MPDITTSDEVKDGFSVEKLEQFQRVIGHQFSNKAFLIQALTHPSWVYEQTEKRLDNQRLEFLGDAVLDLVVTDRLFHLHREAPEGTLTQWRARLVNRQTLEQVARGIDLGSYLQLGRGEDRNRGRERASILSDAMEAVFGAVYCDAGWEAARLVVLGLLENSIQQACTHQVTANAKGSLQEALQAAKRSTPEYRCIEESGPAHAKTYVVEVCCVGEVLGRGTGSSKKEAEVASAIDALGRLGINSKSVEIPE